jgi:RND superfamily putative drug exporter
VSIGLLALAAPAAALDLGPPDVRELPAGNQARADYEQVTETMGPGWGATYELMAAGELRGLGRLGRELSDLEGVAVVLGPARRGDAARFVVVPDTGPTAAATAQLGDALQGAGAGFARRTGAEVAVAGDAAEIVTYDEQTSSRFPLLVAALAVATFLVLAVVLRAVPLALLAVALNLLTVATALGVLTLLFGSASGPLGGAGHLDAVSIAGMYTIIFSLTIDYEVFLLARIREGRDTLGDADAAIAYGLARTAGVLTGAALIMAAVFLAGAASDLATLRQSGIGVAVAILLDATVVRLVLLPALMRLLGERVWWAPRWLGRAVPRSVAA